MIERITGLVSVARKGLDRYHSLRSFLKLTLVVGMVGYMVFIIWRDGYQLLQINITLDWRHLVAAIGLFGVNFILMAIGWHVLAERIGGVNSWMFNLYSYARSYLARLLPTPIWFFSSRVLHYQKVGLAKRVALGLTAVETGVHLVTGLAWWGLASIRAHDPTTWVYGLAILPMLVVLAQPVNLSRWWGGEEGSRETPHWWRVGLWMGLYGLTWMVAGLFLAHLIWAVRPELHFTLDVVWRMWALSSLVAYAGEYLLGGLGVLRELTLIAMLQSEMAVLPLDAMIVSLLARLVLIVAGVLWAGACLTTLHLCKTIRKQ